MKFRLTIYTESGKLFTAPAFVAKHQVRAAVREWRAEHDGERFAFALMLGQGTPGLSNVYGVVTPIPGSWSGLRIRTVQHVQLALTPPIQQRPAHG